MTKTIINIAFLFVILVFLQVSIFNNIYILGIATPIIFIYLLIRLPISMNDNWTLTIGFLLGLTIDIFSNTLGFNALSCTVLSFAKNGILKLYRPKDDDITNIQPTIKNIGFWPYFKFSLTFAILYCTLVFLIESFTFFNLERLILRIIISSFVSFLIILGIDYLIGRKREKRL